MTIDYARAYGNERRAHAETRRRQRAAAAARANGATPLTVTRRAIGRLLTEIGERLAADPSAKPEPNHPIVGARL